MKHVGAVAAVAPQVAATEMVPVLGRETRPTALEPRETALMALARQLLDRAEPPPVSPRGTQEGRPLKAVANRWPETNR